MKGKQTLYGRKQIRLRSNCGDPSYLRSKLISDIHNALGYPSVSANFATLYLNDEYYGLYVLLDIYKKSWIEDMYNESETNNLYNCYQNSLLSYSTSITGCSNENDQCTDFSEWIELLNRLDSAESAEDIEDIFDVDRFLTEMAVEYLTGSYDRFLYSIGHNYFMYKPPKGKWQFLSFDYDLDFGVSLDYMFFGQSTDFLNYSISDWIDPNHLLEILILNDQTRFNKILKQVVEKVFNPATLFPRIDELKDLIRPYVILDKTKNENGLYPGEIKEDGSRYEFSMEDWEASTEYKMLVLSEYTKYYGLKGWILGKYRYVCKTLDMECDKVYLEESGKYPSNDVIQNVVDEEVNIPADTDTNTDTNTDSNNKEGTLPDTELNTEPETNKTSNAEDNKSDTNSGASKINNLILMYIEVFAIILLINQLFF